MKTSQILRGRREGNIWVRLLSAFNEDMPESQDEGTCRRRVRRGSLHVLLDPVQIFKARDNKRLTGVNQVLACHDIVTCGTARDLVHQWQQYLHNGPVPDGTYLAQ